MPRLHARLVQQLRQRPGARMGAFEGRITRWMFVLWIGQIAVLAGILFAFFRA